MKIFLLIALFIPVITVKSIAAVLVNPLEMYVGAEEGVAIYQSYGEVEKAFLNVIFLADGFISLMWGMLVIDSY